MLGEMFGTYRIEAELGSGGMGTVYRAVDVEDVGARPVAVKVVHAQLAGSADFAERFRREAEIGMAVDHPNVVRTLGVGESDGRHYLVMEYVEGQTLEELTEELQRLPEQLCVHIGREVCNGLGAIHAAGAVHRDIKPANVLITPDQVVKVMDLGVARLVDEAARVTQTGVFVGSIHYAAPEQFTAGGKEIDHRIDLHALGLLLYEVATGTPAFSAEEVAALVRQVLHEEPQRIGQQNPQVSPFFEEVVRRLVAKDPDARFASADELSNVLADGESSAWWRERAAELRRADKKPLRRARVPRETALIGREEELERLRGLFDRASSGAGQAVLVEGEAGIGKTRFVDEFVARLEQEGQDVNVLFGSYPPGGGAAATGAFSTAFREHLGEERLEEVLTEYLAGVPALVPAFAALLRGTAPPEGAEPLAKDSLPTAFVHATRALAAERPTIVWIDDLHFAPGEGRSLLASLARAAPGHRVLVLGTARPGVPQEWLDEIEELEHATRLPVSRLGPEDVGRVLVDAFGSEALAATLGPQIATKSDGNPFFLFEIVNDLRRGGLLRESSDGSWAATSRIASIQVPSSVLDLVRSRLRTLSDEERDLLDAAACCGFEFDPQLVGAAVGMGAIEVLRALARIEGTQRLVYSVGRRFVFDHHQVQETLYQDLSDLLREAYHGAVADALEEREGARDRDPVDLDGAVAVDLCRHAFDGGRSERAQRYVDAALDHLIAGSLNEAAVALAERALGADGGLDGEARIDLLTRYAERSGHLGRYALARGALEEAIVLADGAADGASDVARATRARMWLGIHCVYTARLAEAEEVLRQVKARAAELGDDAMLARACASLSTALFRLGRPEEGREHCELAVSLFHRLGDRRSEAQATGNLGTILWRLGRLDEARQLLERHLGMAREVGDRRGVGFATGNLGGLSYAAGRFEDACERYERAIRIYQEVGYRVGECSYQGNLGGTCLALGRLEAGLAHVRSAIRIAREVGQRRSEAVNLINLGAVLSALGDEDGSRDAFEAAAALAREVGATNTVALAVCRLGADAALLGDVEAGRLRIGEALELARGAQARESTVQCLTALGGVAYGAGAFDKARAPLEEALALARESGFDALELDVAARLGALPGGDSGSALAALEEHGDRLEALAALEVRFLLWRATGALPLLAHAHGLLMRLRDHAPPEYHDTMLENVPLHRDIVAAWAEHGAPDTRDAP